MKIRSVASLLFLFTALGCHSEGLDSSFDAAQPVDMAEAVDLSGPTTPDEGTFPAHVTLGQLQPQVIRQNKEGVMATPTVVAVTYDNDTYRADAETFFTQYAASTAWATQTAEYGVGPLTVGTPQHLAGDAPASLSDGAVQELLRMNLASATAPWGAADSNVAYQFFIPQSVKFDDGNGNAHQQGNACCASYGGYHSDTRVNGVDISYAIICECGPNGGPTTPLQDITTTSNHELVEAVTDPFSGTPGYTNPSDDFFGFSLVTEGEVADMCEFATTAEWKPTDMDYTIQRTWSNLAAAAGHDPCVGDGATPYFEAIPYLPDTVDIGQGEKVKSLNIAVGTTGSMTVRVFSDVPGGSVTLRVDDVYAEFTGGAALLGFVVPPGPFLAGTDVQIQVTVKAQDLKDLGGPFEPFALATTPVGGGSETYYYGIIGQ
ncbi:MAG: hypothetical protein ABI321_20705 [Polyangia bacterium]